MKALSKLKPEEGIWMIEDANIPEIGPNDVLVKIKKSAICGIPNSNPSKSVTIQANLM